MTAYQDIDRHASGHRFDTERRWAAALELGFEARTESEPAPVTRLVRRRHHGPLRVQRPPFYPEGKTGCCHVYLLHPPGGLVSGDELRIEASVAEGGHALLTTPPAAAKLYKADSHGVAWGGQHTRLQVAKDAILEYLPPQETIAFDGSRGCKPPPLNWKPTPEPWAGKCSRWAARPATCRLPPANWNSVSI